MPKDKTESDKIGWGVYFHNKKSAEIFHNAILALEEVRVHPSNPEGPEHIPGDDDSDEFWKMSFICPMDKLGWLKGFAAGLNAYHYGEIIPHDVNSFLWYRTKT